MKVPVKFYKPNKSLFKLRKFDIFKEFSWVQNVEMKIFSFLRLKTEERACKH